RRRRDPGALRTAALARRFRPSEGRAPVTRAARGPSPAAGRTRQAGLNPVNNDADPDRTSPLEDGFAGLASAARAQATAFAAGTEPAQDHLKLLRAARPRLTQYFQEHLSAPMDASYRAFRNKHFNGSKYWHTEYRNRSKLFRPKTRTAVRKADAAA